MRMNRVNGNRVIPKSNNRTISNSIAQPPSYIFLLRGVDKKKH